MKMNEEDIINEIESLVEILKDAEGEDAAFLNGEIAVYRMLL